MASVLEDEVRAFNRVFEQALADQDVEGLVALYTDDARLMFAGQPAIQGRAAVEAKPDGSLRIAIDSSSSDGTTAPPS